MRFPHFCKTPNSSQFPAVMLIALVLAGAQIAGGQPEASPTLPDNLIGCWYGEARHQGTTGRLAFEIERNDQGKLIGFLSILDIDVQRLPMGAVAADGDKVKIGPLALTYDSALQTLSGVLPPAMVPVHKISIRFSKIDKLEHRPQPKAELPAAVPVWRFDTASPIWAGLAYQDGVVFAGNDSGMLYALDAESGKAKWSFRAEGAIRSRPSLHNDALFIQADDGFVYRLQVADGSQRWRAPLNANPAPRLAPGDKDFRYDHYASAATVANGLVYIGNTDKQLHALDAESGAVRWSFATGDIVTSTPAVLDSVVIVGSFDGSVYALHAISGALLWRHATGAAIPSSPAIYQQMVIIGSRSYDILALDVLSGKPVWNQYYWFSWVESSATVRDGIAYLGSSDAQRLSAFDAGDGTVRWQFDTGGSAWAQPAVGDHAVFLGCVGVAEYFVDHRAAFFAVDKRHGKGLWKYSLERPGDARMWGFAASPAIGNGRVFAATLDGALYAFVLSPVTE